MYCYKYVLASTSTNQRESGCAYRLVNKRYLYDITQKDAREQI